MRRCEQINCEYYIKGGCQECEKCGSQPYVINIDCENCYACENEPDELRFGSHKPLKEESAIKVSE